MRIRVFHETNYTYEQPARGLIQLLRLRPRDHDGQYVRRWRIEPSVDGRVSEREDGFGNVTHWFTADEPADALTIRVTGEVDTNEMHGIVRGTVERLPDVFYLRDSDLAVANTELQAFAKSVVDEGDSSVLPCLHRLLAAVFDTVAFEPGPASASTTAAQSFAAGKGVCQDLAHIFIAARATSRDSCSLRLGLFLPRRRRGGPGSGACLGGSPGARPWMGRFRPCKWYRYDRGAYPCRHRAGLFGCGPDQRQPDGWRD